MDKTELKRLAELSCFNYHRDGTPIVTDKYIMGYAEAVLRDYKLELLKEPGRINAEHFLESYLGATLDFQDIYYEEKEKAIAGATVFNDGKILIFDREKMSIHTIDVKANTIIIDNDTVKDGHEGYALFTMLHEGGHLCMHQSVYRQLSLAARECSMACTMFSTNFGP